MRIRRVLQNKSLAVGVIVSSSLVFVAVLAPYVTLYDPLLMDMSHRLERPSGSHILGTDNFGRDLWARMAYGARLSLGIALVTVTVSAALGTTVGLVAGYYGGWIDLLLMRVVDLVLSFPIIILAMALIAVVGPGLFGVAVALVCVFWAQYARVTRAIVLRERESSYVEAAKAIGASNLRVLGVHILRNAWSPLVVLATLGLGTAILSESALSFLGFGVQPPQPSWGWTLSYGLRLLRSDPWLATVSGAAIMLTVLGFNLLGDGLRSYYERSNVPQGLRKKGQQHA